MADTTPRTPTTPVAKEFNVKVAELIKNSKSEDIVEILRDESSLMVKHQTQNHYNERSEM